MSGREKRLAFNEALFREMNERVEERVRSTGRDNSTVTILCECSGLDCTERIVLTAREYEAGHSDPAQFTVVPGHATGEIEEVVARSERFEVVRKRGLAGEVAEALDS